MRVFLAVITLFVFLWARGSTTVLPASAHTTENPWIGVITDPPEPQLDLYGNEVNRAMGDYRIDPRGNLYEFHAPHTALLRHLPPST